MYLQLRILHAEIQENSQEMLEYYFRILRESYKCGNKRMTCYEKCYEIKIIKFPELNRIKDTVLFDQQGFRKIMYISIPFSANKSEILYFLAFEDTIIF